MKTPPHFSKRDDGRQAQIKPYVIQGRYGPVEVADLLFGDGTIACWVPCANFSFVEEED